jgi:hypothetical protein
MKAFAAAVLAFLLLPRPGSAAWWRPRWTREKPAIHTHAATRLASAVGYAKLKMPGLSRDAAEDQARTQLLRLMKGLPEGYAAANLPGARVTQAYTDRHGGVYVRMEFQLP